MPAWLGEAPLPGHRLFIVSCNSRREQETSLWSPFFKGNDLIKKKKLNLNLVNMQYSISFRYKTVIQHLSTLQSDHLCVSQR